MAGPRFVVEADGGSRGNPGPAGYGAVVKDADGTVLAEAAESIGTATNNVAEYRGLIAGLKSLLALGGEGGQVEVRMDSKLVIEQMAGRWKVKHEGLRPLALEAAALARRLRVTWTWIPRERNTHADRLANEAMDAAARGETWKATGVTGSTGSAGSAAVTGSAGPGRPAAGEAFATEVPGAAEAVKTAELAGAAEVARAAGGAEVAEAAEPPNTDAADTADRGRRGHGWMPRATRVATSLLLLRHGETPLSIEKRFSGLGDPALTSNGLSQAEAAALRLSRKPYDIEAIVSSPLTRARQTAEAVAARTGLTVLVEEDLRETDFGAWEGHTFAEIQQRWPDQLAAWLADPDAAPPGGESFTATALRVDRARDRIVRAHEGRSVVVVSHVTPIKMLVRSALGAPLDSLYRMHLDLACLSAVDYYADGPAVVRLLNDTAHLQD
ncbi:bifunctional RNase H/acid phosphatase [Microbispora sp. ATCC PTA-5024]|uniref:bifunctional RNase H/acid phosphatase n=1 Tax=Microbispora sp. ATCC PTA-5024 TaxID=316330 RepID=UPI0003DD84AC|nr:bifunctional RNase H/acid phosphatase [Microbispora sp. ATCC PTA-5024]ETK32370.1 bifunctional RNase H/acid phosphatase [Microbispora sp. ATCC PTA-5024]